MLEAMLDKPFERRRGVSKPCAFTPCTTTQYLAPRSNWHAPGTSAHAWSVLSSIGLDGDGGGIGGAGGGGDVGAGGALGGGGMNGTGGGSGGKGSLGGAGGGATVWSGRQKPLLP